MPEGPETRRSADRIAVALAGQIAREVSFAFDELRAFERQLSGSRVSSVRSRGKAILTEFENGLTVYSHNQLYGRWYVRKRGSQPKTNRQLRLAIRTDTHAAYLYSASDIDVLQPHEVAEHPFLARLGPDLLDDELTVTRLSERLASTEFRRRSVAALLLDQSFVAGTGNYLRSEMLHFAGIAPERRPASLGSEELTRLAECIRRIGRRAYRDRGITNPPDRVRALRAEGLPRSAYRHAVFGRDRRPCHHCGTRIERVVAAGRRLYVCRDCQT